MTQQPSSGSGAEATSSTRPGTESQTGAAADAGAEAAQPVPGVQPGEVIGVRPGEFAGRTMVLSGGSRGIGLAIALGWARGGGNVAFLSKTDAPDPRLPGTVHTAQAAIRAAGGQAVGVVGDLRRDDDVQRLVDTAVREFGGIDVCVNNASVLNLAGTADLSLKRYDLMQDVNARGTFALTKACLPALTESGRGHVITLSPPLNLDPRWLAPHTAYALAKYGMTLLTLGFAQDFRDRGIAADCLWPATTIKTAAVGNLLGGEELMRASRDPAIVADAVLTLLRSGSDAGPGSGRDGSPGADTAGSEATVEARGTGRTLLDEDVLAEAGIGDLAPYGGEGPFQRDFFLD